MQNWSKLEAKGTLVPKVVPKMVRNHFKHDFMMLGDTAVYSVPVYDTFFHLRWPFCQISTKFGLFWAKFGQNSKIWSKEGSLFGHTWKKSDEHSYEALINMFQHILDIQDTQWLPCEDIYVYFGTNLRIF